MLYQLHTRVAVLQDTAYQIKYVCLLLHPAHQGILADLHFISAISLLREIKWYAKQTLVLYFVLEQCLTHLF